MDIVVITYVDDKGYEYLVIVWPSIGVPTIAAFKTLIDALVK